MTATNPTPTPEQRDAARQRLHDARVAVGKVIFTGTGEPMTEERQKRLDAAKAELDAATRAMKELGIEEERRKGADELRELFSRKRAG
jgi:hypothetical protein